VTAQTGSSFCRVSGFPIRLFLVPALMPAWRPTYATPRPAPAPPAPVRRTQTKGWRHKGTFAKNPPGGTTRGSFCELRPVATDRQHFPNPSPEATHPGGGRRGRSVGCCGRCTPPSELASCTLRGRRRSRSATGKSIDADAAPGCRTRPGRPTMTRTRRTSPSPAPF